MPFTGKATYSAGASLPEIAEDVSDLVGIVSPFETPLLDAIGDPQVEARSTHHEWLEDTLLPNTDAVTTTPTNPQTDTEIEVDHPDRFRVGDQGRCGDNQNHEQAVHAPMHSPFGPGCSGNGVNSCGAMADHGDGSNP